MSHSSESHGTHDLNAPDLSTLVEKLREAKVGSRDLDADIYEALGYEVKRQSKMVDRGWRRTRTVAFRYRDGKSWIAMSRLTTDLSAIVALVEKMLPDFDYIMGKTNGGLTVHFQIGPDADKTAFSETLPLAGCIALIAALQSEATNV